MDIRKKSLAVLAGIVVIVIVIFTCVSYTLYLQSYKTLESNHVNDTVVLVLTNINTEICSLDSTTKDWGPWDDTYVFVNGEKTRFIESYLIKETFEDQHLNFIIITNRENVIIYGKGFDEDTKTFTSLRPDMVAELSHNTSSLYNLNTEKTVSGFLSLPHGLVMVSSYPIVKNNFSGPPRGSIIMGRYFDDAEILRLSHDTRLKISVTPVNESSLSPGERSFLLGSSDSEILTRVVNDDVVEGDTLIKDIDGNNALIISIQMPRDIYHHGTSTVTLFVYILLAVLLVVGFLIIWLIDSQVLQRFTTINQEIAVITEQKEHPGRIKNSGNDEISRLVDALNHMLDQIDGGTQALIQSEKRFRELAEQFPEIMLEVDAQGIPTFVNHAAYSIFGYTPAEIQKEWRAFDFVVSEDRERLRNDFARLLHGESLAGTEYTAIKKDGSRFAVIVYATPIISEEKIAGVRIFAGDISERKRMEDALRHMNEKMNLLSNITRHDILNQLTALRGYMYLARENVDDKKNLLAFFDKGEKIAVGIEHQIQFTKDYQDMGATDPAWQNVSESITKAIARLPVHDIRVDIDRRDLEIYADPLAEKVFYNLIDNALRYGGEQMTTIRISSQESDNGLMIVCEDDGAGISEVDKKRLFTKGFGKNTGLGLFLSREIFAITGITITETGEPGKGARFEITVPKGNYRFTHDMSG